MRRYFLRVVVMLYGALLLCCPSFARSPYTDVNTCPDLALSFCGFSRDDPYLALFELKNTSHGFTYQYGKTFTIEKNVCGQWYVVPFLAGQDVWTLLSYTIRAGEEKTLSIPMDAYYGTLEHGTYRLLKLVSHEDGSAASECCQDYVLAAEFTIPS